MATRMQQRRGTAEQWTTADPILAPGEIGFETDTSQFKIGDGVNNWSDLSYFKNLEDLGGTLDDYVALTQKGANGGVASLDSQGHIPIGQLANLIDGAPANLDTLNEISDMLGQLNDHASASTNIHGIANTANLIDQTALDVILGGYITTAALDPAIDTIVGTHSADTTSVHGITDTAALATKTYADTAVSDHTSDSTNVHGISDTSALATKTYADDAVSTHSSDSTSVHGIADTSALATKTYADNSSSTAVSDHSSDTTSVHGISDTSKLVMKNAASTTLDGNLTVDGDLTINGTNFSASATSITIEDNIVQLAHQNAANTVDLGLVVAYNDGAAKHSGLVRDVSDAKWKLFKGVTTEPSTTVDFTQGSLDDLAVNNITAAGVVFSDGTQTKEGVPSRTPIISKTADYVLSALSERDSLIEVNSSSAVTITIPTNSAVAFPIGTTLDILGVNTGLITIAGDTGVTVNATPGLKLRTQWSSCTLFKRAENSWVIYGDLKA
jgi:hypothetical protein